MSANIMNSDGRLVRRVLKGRLQAFEGLVNRYWGAAHAVAYAVTRNWTEAEDAAQDAFIEAFRKLHRLDAPASFGPWLTSIARNRALDRVRAERRRGDVESAAGAAAEETVGPEAHAEGVEAMLRELDDLPPEQREALALRYLAGHSVRETASLLEITPDAAAKRLQRAREALGQRVAEALAAQREREAAAVGPKSKAVMGIVGALHVDWLQAGTGAAASASAAGTAASFGLTAKILAAGAIAIVLAVGVITVSNTQPEGAAAVAPAEPTVQNEPVDAEPEPKPQEPAQMEITLVGVLGGAKPAAVLEGPDGRKAYQPGDAVAPEVILLEVLERAVRIRDHGAERVIEQPPLEPSEALEEEVETPDLSGPWFFTENMGDAVSVSIAVEHEPRTGAIRITPEEYPEENMLEGRVEGRKVQLAVTKNPANAFWELEGELNEDFTRITLGINIKQPVPEEAKKHLSADDLQRERAVVFERVTEEMQQQLEKEAAIKAERMQFMRDLGKASESYTAVHGKLPPKLGLLAPTYIRAEKLEDEPGRTLTYQPYELETFSQEPFTLPKPDDPALYRDYLLELEAGRKAQGVERVLFPKPFLTAEWQAPAQTLWVVDVAGEIQVHEPPKAPTEGIRRRPKEAALRAACQNNLKQLGIVVRMFEGENRGYTPPGWCTMYPEYLSDPAILTCPKDAPGTESYIYLQPAERWDDLLAEDPSLQQHGVPLIVDRHSHNSEGRALRNVLFWDGHVESVRVDGERWNEQVAPWLPEGDG